MWPNSTGRGTAQSECPRQHHQDRHGDGTAGSPAPPGPTRCGPNGQRLPGQRLHDTGDCGHYPVGVGWGTCQDFRRLAGLRPRCGRVGDLHCDAHPRLRGCRLSPPPPRAAPPTPFGCSSPPSCRCPPAGHTSSNEPGACPARRSSSAPNGRSGRMGRCRRPRPALSHHPARRPPGHPKVSTNATVTPAAAVIAVTAQPQSRSPLPAGHDRRPDSVGRPAGGACRRRQCLPGRSPHCPYCPAGHTRHWREELNLTVHLETAWAVAANIETARAVVARIEPTWALTVER